MGPIALITGASSGFGKATAEIFAKHGWDVIITGRRQDRLDAFADELRKAHGHRVLALTFDVRDKEAVRENLGNLPPNWNKIDVLVNNAGLALDLSPIDKGNTDDWDTMIDTNIKGLLYVTRTLSPLMIKQGKGHIINIGSTAGKEVYANGNVYCATKFAVDALTKACRMDLVSHNIRVTQVAPGLAETEFSIVRFKGDEERAKKVYEGIEALRPEDIADVVYFAATRPAHVCLNDIVLMPTAQAGGGIVHRKTN